MGRSGLASQRFSQDTHGEFTIEAEGVHLGEVVDGQAPVGDQGEEFLCPDPAERPSVGAALLACELAAVADRLAEFCSGDSKIVTQTRARLGGDAVGPPVGALIGGSLGAAPQVRVVEALERQ